MQLEKQCSQCGEVVQAEANFCPSCGASSFKELPPGLAQHLHTSTVVPAGVALRVSMGRVIALSILSFGLWFFWWYYITWKQLTSEIGGQHYPIWHTLTLFVPVYSLFRAHRHMSVIKDLALQARVVTSLSPGIVVVLLALSGALDGASLSITDTGTALTMALISVALTTTIIAWAQPTLNSYWAVGRGASLQEARVGVGEVILVIIGILSWIGYLFPPV